MYYIGTHNSYILKSMFTQCSGMGQKFVGRVRMVWISREQMMLMQLF